MATVASEMVILISAISVSACAHAAGSNARTGPTRAPYATSPAAFPRANPFAKVAAAVGLPDLAAVTLPTGWREIRITDWYPMMYGERVALLRVVEGHDTASAEVFFWWATAADRPAIYNPPGQRCGAWVEDRRVCTWRAKLRSDEIVGGLERLGAWTLRDDCAPGLHPAISDAGELLMQRLVGSEFEFYACNAPGHRDNAVGRQAAAILRYLDDVARRVQF